MEEGMASPLGETLASIDSLTSQSVSQGSGEQMPRRQSSSIVYCYLLCDFLSLSISLFFFLLCSISGVIISFSKGWMLLANNRIIKYKYQNKWKQKPHRGGFGLKRQY
jgi:hypothetical protein